MLDNIFDLLKFINFIEKGNNNKKTGVIYLKFAEEKSLKDIMKK